MVRFPLKRYFFRGRGRSIFFVFAANIGYTSAMRILMLGDVFGRPGRMALKNHLPALREKFGAEIVIANGENASGGVGLTLEGLRELLAAGVDVVTGGNHIWRHKDVYGALDKEPRLLRPANYPPGAPGRGLGLFDLPGGRKVAVMNLLGRVFVEGVDCPFRAAEALLAQIPAEVRVRVVDFHAEASSEKKALGWFLDGKISLLAGTHTHVQTNDARILPQGAGYLTDLGMCGVEDSVIGMDAKSSVERFVSGLPVAFKPAKGAAGVSGLWADIDEASGRAVALELVNIPAA